ncbi:MAG: CRISPR-associated protein Cas5 [Candidatus Aenigmarchaeota archaeon]|nr:CRISPR-associated protein Cas5 [Candidatus Aenigmarchaeota archaeon]
MEALIVKISFFEAFFKVHYTKGFRLTYPIPLPTSVAGIFGALLGVTRDRMRELQEFLFGAKVVKYDGYVNETTTFLQYKSYKVERGVAPMILINKPVYLMAIAGNEERIREIENKIRENVEFLPYGGQNDFFPEDWAVIGRDPVSDYDEITNYAPQDWIDMKIENNLNIELQIYPVMHTLSDNPNFYFLTRGRLKLKRKIPCTKSEKIALYYLRNFRVSL